MIIETVYIYGMPLPELITLFECDIPSEYGADYYDGVAWNIAQTDPEYLLTHIHEYSGSRLRGAVFGIGSNQNKSAQQEQILVSFLEHADPLIVATAIDAMRYSNYGDFWPLIKPLLQHKSPYVVGAALRYARFALSKEEAFLILTDALTNSHSIILQNAIDELDELGDERAIPLLSPYCEASDPDVKQAANTAVENLGMKK